MIKTEIILYFLGLILFLFPISNIHSQFVQTEGPLDSLHIFFIESYDSFIFTGTNSGLYYTKQIPGHWQQLTSSQVSAFASSGKLVFSGGQSAPFIKCDLSKPYIQIDTLFRWESVNCLYANDSFVFAGNTKFTKINLYGHYSKDIYCEGLPEDKFQINSITQIKDKLFCATNKGIYTSNTRDLVWSPTNIELFKNEVQFVKAINDTLFAGINNYLYFSTDTGNNWRTFFKATSFITSIILNEGVYFVSTFGDGIYISPFGIFTWTKLNWGLTDLYVTNLGLIKNTLICGTKSNGLFYNLDGIWHTNNSGMQSSHIWSMTVSNSGIITSNKYDVYFSSDTYTWLKITPNKPYHHYEHYGKLCSCGDTVYLSSHREYTEDNYIYYTFDNGLNWNKITSVPDDTYSVLCKNGRLYISKDDLIYYTNDLGITWFQESSNNFIKYCQYNPSDPFCDKRIQQLILQTDQNWTRNVNEFPLIPYKYYLNYVVNTNDALFANYYLSIYVKSDTCPYWTQVANSPSFNCGIRSFAYSGKNLFIATLDYGIYYTEDYGISWSKLNTFPVETNMLGILAIKDSTLYIGTFGKGLWKFNLSALNLTANALCPCEGNFISSKINIYPNPVSQFLYIQSNDSIIDEVRIYDISGKLMINQNVKSGEPIDLEGFIEGVYIITIKAQNKIVNRKICVFH